MSVKIIDKFSLHLKNELDLSEEKVEVVAYGAYAFLSGFVGLISILFVAWVFGVVKLAVIAAFTASGLRIISGGAHSQSLRNCSLLGALVSPGIALVSKKCFQFISTPFLGLLVVLVLIFNLYCIYKFVPADTPSKPIRNEEKKKRLRLLSFIYLILWFSLGMGILFDKLAVVDNVMLLASTLGLLWQAFSLTPWGYRLVAKIDTILP